MKLQSIIDSWNDQADEHNQWQNLSTDEQIEYAVSLVCKVALDFVNSATSAISRYPFDSASWGEYKKAKESLLKVIKDGIDPFGLEEGK